MRAVYLATRRFRPKLQDESRKARIRRPKPVTSFAPCGSSCGRHIFPTRVLALHGSVLASRVASR